MKKMKLSQLQVKSFVTKERKNSLKGGISGTQCGGTVTDNECFSDVLNCNGSLPACGGSFDCPANTHQAGCNLTNGC